MAQPEQLRSLEIIAGILSTTIREDPRRRIQCISGTDRAGQRVSIIAKQETLVAGTCEVGISDPLTRQTAKMLLVNGQVTPQLDGRVEIKGKVVGGGEACFTIGPDLAATITINHSAK